MMIISAPSGIFQKVELNRSQLILFFMLMVLIGKK